MSRGGDSWEGVAALGSNGGGGVAESRFIFLATGEAGTKGREGLAESKRKCCTNSPILGLGGGGVALGV